MSNLTTDVIGETENERGKKNVSDNMDKSEVDSVAKMEISEKTDESAVDPVAKMEISDKTDESEVDPVAKKEISGKTDESEVDPVTKKVTPCQNSQDTLYHSENKSCLSENVNNVLYEDNTETKCDTPEQNVKSLVQSIEERPEQSQWSDIGQNKKYTPSDVIANIELEGAGKPSEYTKSASIYGQGTGRIQGKNVSDKVKIIEEGRQGSYVDSYDDDKQQSTGERELTNETNGDSNHGHTSETSKLILQTNNDNVSVQGMPEKDSSSFIKNKDDKDNRKQSTDGSELTNETNDGSNEEQTEETSKMIIQTDYSFMSEDEPKDNNSNSFIKSKAMILYIILTLVLIIVCSSVTGVVVYKMKVCGERCDCEKTASPPSPLLDNPDHFTFELFIRHKTLSVKVPNGTYNLKYVKYDDKSIPKLCKKESKPMIECGPRDSKECETIEPTIPTGQRISYIYQVDLKCIDDTSAIIWKKTDRHGN